MPSVSMSFSNLWRFSGGATELPNVAGWREVLSVISGDSLVGQRPRRLTRGWLLILSVISGDSLVGQPLSDGVTPTGCQSFSNLWRFSGGATKDQVAKGRAQKPFSNLWRFSGGATTVGLPGDHLPIILSVISGDSLVGQPPPGPVMPPDICTFSNLWRFSGGATWMRTAV